MALRGTLTHRKTRRLGMLLGIDPPEALGLMEALWHVAGERKIPDGSVGEMTDDDLAMEMHSTRDGGTLIAAMVKAGLLDAGNPSGQRVDAGDPSRRLVVHDWHEHSDDAANARLARAGRRYAGGQPPRLTKFSHAERDGLMRRFPGIFESVRTSAHNGALPEPEPEPDPEKTTPPLPPAAQGESVCDSAVGDPVESERVAGGAVVTVRHGSRQSALRHPDPGRDDPPEAKAAVAKVQRECNLADPRMTRCIRAALWLEATNTDEPPDWNGVAERMCAAQRRFVEFGDRGLLKWPVKMRRFFAEMWKDEGLWPLNLELIRERGRVF